ncbi:MAG: Methyltransferase type 11 [Candidatus Levybacteria bacterium GW2011_GWA1_39_32]|nr:MAG: Methyltransferase type 11 [Candidatus Levybacteria bacterium GW2011_GWB1_36_18]KKR17687.1 MAG: Methyltransferase type 11 [Candidatus Levybacteria bacterium GW2011_GWA1_39_32]
MKKKLKEKLENINFLLSKNAQSRPSYQVKMVIDFLLEKNKGEKYKNLLDVGGGFDAAYKEELSKLSRNYLNLEIKKGGLVNIVGSVYRMPFKANEFNIICLFMVMEHLNEPLKALKECSRILKKGGYVAITTVQYWQTHNYPSDYFRYTRNGLEYLCNKAGLKVVKAYSHGGPWLVLFHVIEINLRGPVRIIFSIVFYKLFNFLDWIFFRHYDRRVESDSLGWTFIASKT